MRDTLLATAGNLDTTFGGRPLEITAPPYTDRRTVYARIDRVNLDQLFATFDFPSPAQSAPERPQTMVPQQALFAMNDGFSIHQSKVIASEITATEAKNVRQDRLHNLYQRLFQRAPTPAETQLATAFLEQAIETNATATGSAWTYGYGNPDPEIVKNEEKRFTEFPFFDPKQSAYRFGNVFPHPKWRFLDIDPKGGHPGATPAISPIWRWTAPYSGAFRIQAELTHQRDKGDGVQARIHSSREGELGSITAFMESKTRSFPSVELEAGDHIDFVVDCRTGTNSDRFFFNAQITRTAMSELDQPGMATTWDTQSDFAGPPPPPLGIWPQLAHALFQTNEFLFID